jgi:signal transduction histidine kinase/tetratricopeptide (TPR) repeat protein
MVCVPASTGGGPEWTEGSGAVTAKDELPGEVVGSAGRLLGGRYRPTRELKSGGGVTTLVAIDVETGAEVVVKMVGATAVSAGARMRLEHESRMLRDLDSPRLTSILDVVVEDGALFLVMPLAEGESLEHRLAGGPLDVRSAVAVGVELLRGLAEAHASGVVHRDVKPANVVVAGVLPDIRLTVVDFGLARSGWLEQPLRELPVGTARYVSPEQAGILHHDVDERADLYSAGAVLFECLAGRPPFDDATVGEVLRAHASVHPPRLRSLGLDVPAALDEIVQRLLRKDPRDRYQTAAAVVADLEQLGAALAAGGTDPSIVIGVHDVRRTITEPAFVGRARELAALDRELRAARLGDGALVLLEAESGGGKSRLLDELAYRASAGGAWVLRGQGLDQAATLPFQVLTGVAEEIAEAVTPNDRLAAALRARLADHADSIRSALPALGTVLPEVAGSLGKEEHGPARVLASLTALLDALDEGEQPALVLLDDCQWADEPTVRLLDRWAAQRPTEGRRTMVVAAFRSEEVGHDHPLRRVHASLSLALLPFGETDVRGLIESMAGPLPDEAVRVVEDLSAGSPFMASAVLRGLVEVGALVRDHDAEAWEVDAAAVVDVQSSRRAAAFLARRLRLLPEPARRVLLVGAVLGKEFDLDLAADLAGQLPGAAVAAVDDAARRHILWTTSHGGRCAFVHDKLRESLLADLTAEDLAALHLRAAERLEAETPQPVFELGYHFDAAGHPDRALPYALAAGDEARRRHALELAERQYRVAARGAGDSADARLHAAMGLGAVLLLQGRYDEAGGELAAALADAPDDATRAEIERSLGDLSFKRGDVTRAAQHQQRALSLMDRRTPRSAAVFVVRLLWEVLVQAVHTLRPARLGRGDPTSPQGRADLAAARVYSDMAYSFWFGQGRVPCAWSHLRGMNTAERYPPGAELAQAWSEHAPVMTMAPWYRRALAYAERSFAVREQLGDVWGQGQSLGFYGVALYASSQYEACIDRCRRAIRLLQRTGDQWEINTATWHVAFAQYRLGQLDAAVATAQRVHRAATEIGDHQAAGIALGVWSKAAEGDLPRELVRVALERDRSDVHASAEVLTAEALRCLHEDRIGDGLRLLEEADRLVRKAGLRQEYVSPVVAWLTTAQRLQLERLGAWAPARRRRLLRRARRTSRRALRTARWYRNNQPHALREAGLLAALAGRDGKARALLDRSLAVAAEQGARQERALSLVARGRAGVAGGWTGAADALAEGERLLAEVRISPREPEEERRTTLSLVDRFDRLLEEGRRVAGALDADDVHSAVRDAAATLLRPQACRVLDLSSSWDDPSGSGGSEEPIMSRTLVERALHLGRPVTSGQDTSGDPGESMLLSSSRSALAAPIYVRGQAVACLYVTHDEVGGLYGEDDERVAQLLTAIAGAALENAEGFAAIQALSRTLEQRVEERTQELAVANRELQVALEREQEVAERLRTLDELKNEFVAMVAHDLRSPMASIAGAAETLSIHFDKLAESDRSMLLDLISRNTLGLSGLVDDVLQVAHIESGQFSYDVVTFDLLSIVERTVNEVEVSTPISRIRIEASVGLPSALGDPERNWQVLTNLLSNALKFSPDDTIVRVRVRVDPADPSFLRIDVVDEGTGIAGEDMPRLFQKFSRIRAADASERVGGTGLGLYICQQVVEAQGGRIWAESRPREGSTFSYTVPTSPT